MIATTPCPQCGKPTDPDGSYCSHCGAKTVAMPTEATKAAGKAVRSARTELIVFITVGVLAIGALLAIIVFRQDQPASSPGPTTTTSKATETLAQFQTRISPKIDALADTMDDMSAAATSGSPTKVRTSAQAMRAAATGLRNELPSPDAELTRLLGRAMDELVAGADLEIASADRFDASKSVLAKAHITQATSLMDQATARLEVIS